MRCCLFERKHTLKSRSLNVLALVVACSGYAAASPFDPRVVSAEAKFVAFVDADAARKTAVGAWVLKRIQDEPKDQDFEKIMIEAAGFMPASDITDITIYGEKYADEPDATLVIRANVDSNKLSNVSSFAKGFELDAYNGHTMMSWDRRREGSPDLCVVQRRKDNRHDQQQRAAAVLARCDRRSTKAMKDDSPLPKRTHKEAWGFALADDLASSPAVMKNEMLSGLLTRGVIECSEEAGKSSLCSPSKPKRRNSAVLNAANGLKAIVQIAASRGEWPRRRPSWC